MQKLLTDKLYIVGLYMITDYDYYTNTKSSKFLKWIVVEDQSDSYSVCFKDIKTKVNYFLAGIVKGDLYIDVDTIYSMNNLTNKQKLGIEEINTYLEEFKQLDTLNKHEKKKKIYEILDKLLQDPDEETLKMINEVINDDNDENKLDKKEFLKDIKQSLELNKKTKVRSR